jgi:hypothetical protein
MVFRILLILFPIMALSCVDISSPTIISRNQYIPVSQIEQIKGTWALKTWCCLRKHGTPGEGWAENCTYYPLPEPPESLTFFSQDSNFHSVANLLSRFTVNLDTSQWGSSLSFNYQEPIGTTVFDSIGTRSPQFSFILQCSIDEKSKTQHLPPIMLLTYSSGGMYFSQEWQYYLEKVE